MIKARKFNKVLDVGAGTGLLAIAAARTGTKLAVGTDIDKPSVRISKENAKVNKANARFVHASGLSNQLVARNAPYDLVFATQIGTPLGHRNVQRDFKKALARAGLPASIRFHDLRHFAATTMLAAGVHPKVASERLGHSQVGITLDLYSHVVEGLDADAAERIERAIRGVRG